jgi:hypothetical protein
MTQIFWWEWRLEGQATENAGAKAKCEGLRCAAHDETVSGFGREDAGSSFESFLKVFFEGVEG